jgi:hypothetical protein
LLGSSNSSAPPPVAPGLADATWIQRLSVLWHEFSQGDLLIVTLKKI